jgi:hypothetical protein
MARARQTKRVVRRTIRKRARKVVRKTRRWIMTLLNLNLIT